MNGAIQCWCDKILTYKYSHVYSITALRNPLSLMSSKYVYSAHLEVDDVVLFLLLSLRLYAWCYL